MKTPRIETAALLFCGLIIYTGLVLLTAWAMPSNEKVYVFLSGIAGSFSGSLFTYLQLKNSAGPKDVDPKND